MKMNIEKYLKENRLKLDAEKPDDGRLWQGIRKELHHNESKQNNWFWKVAAIFLLGVLTTYVVVKETTHDRVVIVSLGNVSKELGQEEMELQQIVNKKWDEIKPLTAEQESEFQFLLDELNDLDKIYKSYEEDLYKSGENEQIVNALLDYYQKKIRLLNRLSMEIERQKNMPKDREFDVL